MIDHVNPQHDSRLRYAYAGAGQHNFITFANRHSDKYARMTETPGYPDTGRSGAPENPNVETGLNQKNKEMDNPADPHSYTYQPDTRLTSYGDLSSSKPIINHSISGDLSSASNATTHPTFTTFYKTGPTDPTKRSARIQNSIIERLPIELLQMVFNFHFIGDGSLLDLLLVCKRWNQVAINYQRLWSRILVAADHRPASLTRGSTISCFGEDLLKQALFYAGNTLLETTLVIGQINDNSPSAVERRKRYQLVTQHSTRIRFLCLIINPHTSEEEVIESFRGIFNAKGGFPALESFMLASAVPVPGIYEAFSDLLDILNETSKKLTAVYFENVPKRYIMKAGTLPLWRRLKRLTLKGANDPLHITLFQGCNDLEFLSCSGELLSNAENAIPPMDQEDPGGRQIGGTRPPDMSDEEPSDAAGEEWRLRPVVLPQLKWFRAGALTMCGLARIQAPLIRNLVIHSAARDYGAASLPTARSIPMLNLEVLHITTDHPYINAIHAPNLQTLCITISSGSRQDADHLLDTIFDGDADMWMPRNLTIVSRAHSNHIVGALKKSTKIETINITFHDIPTKEFYGAITPKQSRGWNALGQGSSARSPSLASRLRSIHLDLMPANVENPEVIGPHREFLEKIAKARKSTNIPLKVLSCRWNENQPTEYILGDPSLCPRCDAQKKAQVTQNGQDIQNAHTHDAQNVNNPAR